MKSMIVQTQIWHWISASTLILLTSSFAHAADPVMHWDFSTLDDGTTVENVSGMDDAVEGHARLAAGMEGDGLRLDGFTTCVRHVTQDIPRPGDAFSVEAWVALGNYPWNWCPILTTENDETKGYRLMIGPYGQVSMQSAIGEQWVSCTTANEAIPLRKWMHVVGVYRANTDMSVYVNGTLAATIPIQGKVTFPRGKDLECRLGMVATPGKPSNIHRTWGTLGQYFGLCGIIDEVKVYDEAMQPEDVKKHFDSVEMKQPEIEAHKLPTIAKHPGRFGAFYTKLKYYDGWDNVWPVDQDPDIVVCFDKLPVKVMFWRGLRYGTAWVSENENWMSDQSVEAWGLGDDDTEGCFEHMQDRHCRYSHVRVIENNDARVVVHWRYAPTSAYLSTWRVDPKTGWECWVDEYHTIYPDASGTRKVSWKKDTLKFPRQFQESLPLLQPGQVVSDLVHRDYVHVADYEGHIDPVSFVDNPRERDTQFAKDYTIQQYNFKSDNKPFICFEPGNRMSVRWNSLSSYDKHVGCNHFPVGQARCDGRTSIMSDRPSHCDSFPISDPVVHEAGDRCYWNALYGINGMEMEELVELGKSWAFAPEMEISGEGFTSKGYDRSQRCYPIENSGSVPKACEITLTSNDQSPIVNPAFFIKNWNAATAKVLVNGEPSSDVRIGVNHELEGDDLVLFLFLQSNEPVKITVLP
ncbi:LamG domain-containing protein [Novipirellula aureliae]|nr:LamG domain-containing protein [Novipirellula aureliae]